MDVTQSFCSNSRFRFVFLHITSDWKNAVYGSSWPSTGNERFVNTRTLTPTPKTPTTTTTTNTPPTTSRHLTGVKTGDTMNPALYAVLAVAAAVAGVAIALAGKNKNKNKKKGEDKK